MSVRYPLLLADPGWTYDHSRSTRRRPDRHYRTDPLEEIAALDVASMAAPDAVLFCWVPAPLLVDGKFHRAMDAWDFQPRTELVWVKTTAKMGAHIHMDGALPDRDASTNHRRKGLPRRSASRMEEAARRGVDR